MHANRFYQTEQNVGEKHSDGGDCSPASLGVEAIGNFDAHQQLQALNMANGAPA